MQAARRFLGDIGGVVFVLVALAGIAVFSLSQWTASESRSPGSVYNTRANGSQSLANWLRQLGYEVRASQASELVPQAGQQILFVLAPERQFTDVELIAVEAWVRAGGTLIIAQERNRADGLLQQYGLRLGLLWPTLQETRLRLPTLNWPWVGEVAVRASRRVRVDCGLTAVHLGDCDRPILISFGRGKGQVFVISTIYPFTNAGLESGSNGQLVQNLVQISAAPGALILFDEVHRDVRTSWLTQSREGWGVMMSLLLILLYFVFRWRPFGSTPPPAHERVPQRRQTAEFISSLATVDTSDQHTAVRTHYWRRLKRQLGQRYGIDPALPDHLFLAELKPHQNDYQLSAMISVLMALKEPIFSASELQEWTTTVIELGQMSQ